jgi:hypothetical protein
MESAATGVILTPARRAVRFSPVATVVDDEHGHGVVGTAPTGLRDAGAEMARAKESAAEAERKVEELLRALGVADELERAKESSESSSDLFELEGLPAFQDRDNQWLTTVRWSGFLASCLQTKCMRLFRFKHLSFYNNFGLIPHLWG